MEHEVIDKKRIAQERRHLNYEFDSRVKKEHT